MKTKIKNSGYLPELEISPKAAELFPDNCAVIERTADGQRVGACTYYLTDGVRCPRHGRVKVKRAERKD